MGCDIHVFIEHRRSPIEWASDDVWENNKDGWSIAFGTEIYSNRNYELFAALANVRNRLPRDEKPRYMPKSSDGGEPIFVITQPKGIPHDCCLKVQRELERWEGDGHSHSWYTLQELLDFDWHGVPVVNRGLVNKEEYEKLERMRAFDRKHNPERVEYNAPDSYCMGASGGDYKEVEWKSTLGDECSDFLSTVIPKMATIAKRNGVPYSDIRIVFFFDN